MQPGRTTHRFPHGKPFLLVLVDLSAILVVFCWAIFGSRHWLIAVEIVIAFVVLMIINGKLLGYYERCGLAILLDEPMQSEFVASQHAPLRAMRYAYFLLVGVLLFFGFAPVSERVARDGIIACIIILFVTAGAYIALSWYYEGKTGSRKDRKQQLEM